MSEAVNDTVQVERDPAEEHHEAWLSNLGKKCWSPCLAPPCESAREQSEE